jgi:hypothetical protein
MSGGTTALSSLRHADGSMVFSADQNIGLPCLRQMIPHVRICFVYVILLQKSYQ